MRFTFHELSRPLARVRVAEVLFGIVEEYTPDTIKEATLNYAVDPTAEALPSREAIVRRIYKAAGASFSMEAFYASDKVRSDNTTKASYFEVMPPLAPPILIDK